MSVISILGGDFEILFDDEKNQNGGTNAVAGMRTVRRAAGASETIYTTLELYSAIAAASDDFIAMGFKNPMLPTTPNAFTMENYYFIPRSSTEYLKEGAITAAWTAAAPDGDTNGNGVIKVRYTGGTNFVTTDIGRQVTKTNAAQPDDGDTGTLLDFDVDPDGVSCAWIRPDNSTTNLFEVAGGTLAVTADGGTGTGMTAEAGVTGTTQYSAIQAIGAVPTATEVYLYQNRTKITDSLGGFQWWETDPDVSLGIISILIRVRDMGTLIADGDVEVFARRYTSLYDNFRLNVAAGGFSALPLASAPDINNTTGYLTAVLSGNTGTWEAGKGIYVGASWATATARGVVTAVTDGATATPTIEYYLVGDLSTIDNTDTVTEYDFETAADDDGDGTINGIPTATSGGPTDGSAGEGGTVTITLGHTDVDHTGDGATEPYSITINAQSAVPIAKVYERLKYVTRRGADEAALFGAGVQVPGESYRGLDGIFEYDADTEPPGMTEGDNILTTTGGSTWTARLAGYSNATTPTYITVMDQQTSLDSVVDNDLITDEAVEGVTVHAGGTVGLETFTSPKSSPFGTFTGSQIFGARGVAFINPGPGDAQSYILTDDFGNLNNPPNTVSFTVSNTAAGDRILVARDTGTPGVINKDQFGGMATPTATGFNNEGDTTIRVAGSIDTEVPAAGWVRVVETTLRQEHRYKYASRTTGASGEFTLTTYTTGAAATAGTSTTSLFDTGATFQTDGVEPGLLIQDTTNGDFYEVVSVVSETELEIVQIFGTGGAFAAGDTYTINALIQDYANTDNLYDLILDREATGTTVSNTFIKTLASDFDVVVNVRQGKVILPFTQNTTQGDGNTTVTVVRQPDTIAV